MTDQDDPGERPPWAAGNVADGSEPLPPRPLALEAAIDPASPGAAPLLDMHTSGGHPHEMTNTQVRDVRAMLLRDHFAFSYLIAGNKDLYPPVHGPLSNMMERWGTEGWRRLMAQIPRSAFKTSHLTIAGTLWKVCNDPNTTIAVFNEKVQRVERWFLAIQSIVTGNDLFQVIFPEVIPPGLSRRDRAAGRTMPKSWKWSSQEMNFNRTDWTLKEPTMTAIGAGAASAGGHYWWCFLDDIISEEARRSPVVMQAAKEWLDTAKYLGMTEATWNAFMPCTRWAYDDVYEYACNNHGFHLYRRSAIEDGQSFWPERYPIDALLRDQAKNPASFSSQMLNDPVAGTDLAFNADWLRTCTVTSDDFNEPIITIPDHHYDPTATVIPDMRPPRQVRLADCSKILLVDPAPSSETERRQQPSARTAMILKVRDPWGRRFKIDAWAGREDPIPEVRRMLDMMRLHNCDRIAIEEVVFSKLYKSIMDLVCDQHYEGWRPRYIALKPKGRDKDTRIAGKRGDYESGMEYMVPSLDALWRAEYLTYPYSKTRDLLDAEAYDKDPGVLPRPETEQEQREAEYWHHPHAKEQLGADEFTNY